MSSVSKLRIILLLMLCGCNNTSTNTKPVVANNSIQERILIPTYQNLLPNKEFDSIVETFIKENPCDSCIDEMYIDKVYPTEMFVTLKERMYNTEYLKNQNPLFTISYGQKQFFIYSGLEDIFVGDKKSIAYIDKDANNKVFIKWGISIDSNKYTVDKKYEGIPFFPKSKENGVPKISGIKMIR